MISSKYGEEDLEWSSREALEPFGVGFLKEILKESSWFRENWKFRIGNGTGIRIWLES